eukprot:TRINITY_DN5058_c0_g2_i1.p1 TRINITY_DN5058_c0_g2~~TRINITY_DN5058_c0_g2_i1.p1  ORF type:complete len:122 (-),score=2.93 TRINITY_DN5058_c0_g2_i1:1076-1441(-)
MFKFFSLATSSTSFVAVDMTSSNPPYTISFSLAPSNNPFSASLNFSLLRSVAFSITSIKFFLDFSYHFLRRRPHLTCSIFFNHSKYETVTPPPLHKTSGKKLTPFLSKIYSAARVVGPLAA